MLLQKMNNWAWLLQIVDAIISHGCYLDQCKVQHSIVGLRSRLEAGSELQVSLFCTFSLHHELKIGGVEGRCILHIFSMTLWICRIPWWWVLTAIKLMLKLHLCWKTGRFQLVLERIPKSGTMMSHNDHCLVHVNMFS